MTIDDLRERQGWTLEQKIDHAVGTIQVFCERIKPLHPYVSFSGGKDSTVLLDICRRFVHAGIPAVFCNTGNEWPESVQFVRCFRNVVFIRPKQSMQKVIEHYGFPVISKEASDQLHRLKYSHNAATLKRLTEKWTKGRICHACPKKWRWIASEPWDVSPKCCDALKKQPFRQYDKLTNSRAIIATMACESWLREAVYLKRGGCNSFSKWKTASYPLSIWTEADIWAYIKKFDLPLNPLYLKGWKRTGCMACGFGLQKEPERLEKLKGAYPKLYDHFMNFTNKGTTYREALTKIGIKCP